MERDPSGTLDLLSAIAATPRPTGSEAIVAARAHVSRELKALGFDVRETPFVYSAFPGRFATPLFGGAVLLIVGIAGHLGAAGDRYAPLLIAGLGAIALVLAGLWTSRRGVLQLPVLRTRGVNLEATRPSARAPRVWLCAHLDRKSQLVPTFARVVGIVLAGLGYLVATVLALLAAAGVSAHALVWAAAAVVTLVGSVPVVLCVVGSNSPGALDNASGVAAVLEAARRLDGRDVGVVVTDAEELGLAGARAWSQSAPASADAILNCDGVDDEGENVVMFSGRPPEQLLEAVARASAASAVPCRSRRLALGVLTDSVAFADAGRASVTFSRGSFASLARVHSSRDDLGRLRGDGIAQVATLMAATAEQVGGWETRRGA